MARQSGMRAFRRGESILTARRVGEMKSWISMTVTAWLKWGADERGKRGCFLCFLNNIRYRGEWQGGQERGFGMSRSEYERGKVFCHECFDTETPFTVCPLTRASSCVIFDKDKFEVKTYL
jgi:hypothetical protein